jgi:hypothetical protein
MKLTKLLAPLLAACLAWAGASARAETLPQGPEREPKTQGPLTLDTNRCSDDGVRSEDGTLLGKAVTCLYLYSFDPLSEIDVLRNYGAAWLQASFVPARGWCVTDLGAKVQMSEGDPEGISKTTPDGKKAATKLAITAGGTALEDGEISQTSVRGPGDLETIAPADRPAVVSEWQGKSAKQISLVQGVAYSYEMLAGAPEKISFGFSDFAVESC